MVAFRIVDMTQLVDELDAAIAEREQEVWHQCLLTGENPIGFNLNYTAPAGKVDDDPEVRLEGLIATLKSVHALDQRPQGAFGAKMSAAQKLDRTQDALTILETDLFKYAAHFGIDPETLAADYTAPDEDHAVIEQYNTLVVNAQAVLDSL